MLIFDSAISETDKNRGHVEIDDSEINVQDAQDVNVQDEVSCSESDDDHHKEASPEDLDIGETEDEELVQAQVGAEMFSEMVSD